MSKETFTHEYYEMLKREHRELEESISVVQNAMAAGAADLNAIRDAIRQLCRLLESHFAHEEEGGYMREAIQRAPRISRRADLLLDEHETMLAVIRELTERVCNTDAADITVEELELKFTDFVKSLSKHEAGENSILLEAYTDDIGTKD